MRDAGYTKWDACAPFPVHGLDKAMGLKPSKLPWVVLVVGLSGTQPSACSSRSGPCGSAYPFVVGGKPLFSLPAFVPVWYEMTVLSSCVAAFFGNWVLNGLPRPHHPAFGSKAFERVTDDKFFIMVEAADPQVRPRRRRRRCSRTSGATLVEELEP